MPLWFPFALLSSFLVMMASGSKTGFKTSAELEEEKRKKELGGTGPTVQGGPPLMKKERWPYKGLPYRVMYEGRLFQKGGRFPGVPEAHVVYGELGGPGKLVVLGSGHFIAQAA